MRKAFEMWGWDQGHLALDPETAGWPAFSFYVHLALQHLQYAFGRLTGRYDDRLDFFVEHVDLYTLLPAARFLSVIAAVAVVVVGTRLAQRLVGWRGALAAGSVLAASPLLVEHSLRVTPDILLTLFCALALVSIVDVHEKGRWRDYIAAAVWIALGTASKYTPVLLVPCLVVAHLAREGGDGRRPSLFARRLLVAGAVCGVTFFLATPFTLLNVGVAGRDVPLQFVHVVTAGHFGHELQRPGPFYYLVDALPGAVGWPGLALGLAGLGLAAWRRQGPWPLLLLAFACLYVGLSALRSLHAYYILPALVPLALGLAAIVAELERTIGVTRPRLLAPVAASLLVVTLTPLAVHSTQQALRRARPSTLLESRTFIMEELNGPEVCFASEVGGPRLPRDPKAELGDRPVFGRLDPEQQRRLLSGPFVRRFIIYMYMTRPSGSDVYYDLRHYLDFDYIVVSDLARERYERLAEAFPRQNAFYADLERHCELVRHFPASRDRPGPDVWIYRVLPGTTRILDERGRLTRGFHTGFLDTVRPADLRSFLVFVGVLAEQRENWPAADLYLDTMLDFLTPELRVEMLFKVAYVKLRAGDLVGAAELCGELLRHRPDDPQARALGAEILKRSGRLPESGSSPGTRGE